MLKGYGAPWLYLGPAKYSTLEEPSVTMGLGFNIVLSGCVRAKKGVYYIAVTISFTRTITGAMTISISAVTPSYHYYVCYYYPKP